MQRLEVVHKIAQGQRKLLGVNCKLRHQRGQWNQTQSGLGHKTEREQHPIQHRTTRRKMGPERCTTEGRRYETKVQRRSRLVQQLLMTIHRMMSEIRGRRMFQQAQQIVRGTTVVDS